MYCQPWTGLLFWESAACQRVMPGRKEAQMRADKASSHSESLWIAPSHYLSIIWSLASIFINGDLADGMHLENRSKEVLPSKIKKAESKIQKPSKESVCLLSSRCVVRGLTRQSIHLLGQGDGERMIFQAGKKK